MAKTQACPHLRDFLMSVSLNLSVFKDGTGFGGGREQGGTEAPWCSDVEAFSAAACALDVGIVEDKFARQL